jgi:hypothetical protein
MLGVDMSSAFLDENKQPPKDEDLLRPLYLAVAVSPILLLHPLKLVTSSTTRTPQKQLIAVCIYASFILNVFLILFQLATHPRLKHDPKLARIEHGLLRIIAAVAVRGEGVLIPLMNALVSGIPDVSDCKPTRLVWNESPEFSMDTFDRDIRYKKAKRLYDAVQGEKQREALSKGVVTLDLSVPDWYSRPDSAARLEGMEVDELADVEGGNPANPNGDTDSNDGSVDPANGKNRHYEGNDRTPPHINALFSKTDDKGIKRKRGKGRMKAAKKLKPFNEFALGSMSEFSKRTHPRKLPAVSVSDTPGSVSYYSIKLTKSGSLLV